jgi:hypothetical protein
MSKKKKKQKKKNSADPVPDLESEVQRLRDENEMLRARLGKINELASDLPGHEPDDEDDEYEELTRDVDDVIGDTTQKTTSEPSGVILP